ncbi:MAG: AAA family ATPase [Ruminococcus sp.]|nr:AAA family ATPase [Ruminococcus sp.]
MQTKKILTKLRLVNWHYFSNEMIHLKNTNLFSGDNGAGKSTILDAIQLILTTNSRKFNLAVGAESKRSLKTYVRGKTGEEGNEYLRKGAVISYIALEVYEESKQRYFVIGGKFDSPDLESEVKRKWFCEEGTLDQLSFIVDNKPAKDEQFRNNGKRVVFIHQTSLAKDRFKSRLGHLQDNFFELLAKSIAFKPMKDVKSFVSQFILPEKNIDIDALRENIRNLKEMQLLVEEVKKQVNNLEAIQKKYDDILHFDEQILVIDILIKIAEAEAKKARIANMTSQIRLAEQRLAQDEKARNDLSADIQSLNERYINVQISLNSGESALLIGSIKSDIKDKEKDKRTLSNQIYQLKEQLKRIRTALRYIHKYSTVTDSEISALEQTKMDIQRRNSIVIEIECAFAEAESSIQNQLADTKAELTVLNKALEQLAKEIKDLEQNKLTYDRNVTMLKEAIQFEFSARGIVSEVHILADLLEISNSKWQNAVEGYLNSQRFYIIVEPVYYDIAAEVYDKYKSKIHTAAIVNTAKLNTDVTPDTTSPSLASVVTSENRYAYAYICYLLGRVTMCESVSELKEHRIAITQGCMLYQGNALRKIDPEIYNMPYIGKYALQQQLKIKKAEYEDKSARQSEIKTQESNYNTILSVIKQCNFEILKPVITAPIEMQKITEEIRLLNQKLKEAENDPTYLQLQMEAGELQGQLDSKNKELDNIKQSITRNQDTIERLTADIGQLETEVSNIESQISNMGKGNETALHDAHHKFEEHKKTKSADTIWGNYQPRRETLRNQKEKANNELHVMQSKYKDGELGTGIDMMSAYSEEYSALAKHDLIRYEEQLRVIKDNCETEFRESFLAKIRENIENAITLFKELNKTLKPIYYGNDSYRFDYSADKRKKRLYDMIISDFNLGGFNLFSTQFDEEYHDEMNELFSKLTASDENGDDVLREYTDYRSYLDYDIEIISKDGKSQKFSKIYREKSGGETQTPYYVAIAASFAQLYSTGETIRVIMLDEAFDKMDEERIESMLTFFKSQNFQIILAAPTSRLELIGEQADNIVMIYTDSSHNSFAGEFSYDDS